MFNNLWLEVGRKSIGSLRTQCSIIETEKELLQIQNETLKFSISCVFLLPSLLYFWVDKFTFFILRETFSFWSVISFFDHLVMSFSALVSFMEIVHLDLGWFTFLSRILSDTKLNHETEHLIFPLSLWSKKCNSE